MRTAIFAILIGLVLATPFRAAFADTVERERLIAELNGLLVQLVELKMALYEAQKGQVLGASTSRLEPSKYYSGSYEAIYSIDGLDLVSYDSVLRENDRRLWALWRQVVGDNTVRRYISEFRVYDDDDARYDAFVEQLEGDDWIVGVSTAGVSVRNQTEYAAAVELFVHEYAHILHHYHSDIAADFEETFWTPESSRERDYVSDYAMESTEEDFAESFMYFVLRSTPPSATEAAEKVQFFAAYPVFREERASINSRLAGALGAIY